MQPVEKNEVDISQLFHYGKKFDIKVKNGKSIAAYIRLVGDAELNRARVFALRSSAELRAKLKDKDSDYHKAFIPETYVELSKETLVDAIATFSVQEMSSNIIRDIDVPMPAEPKSDATLEEQENYQKLVDAYPLYRLSKIREAMEIKIEAYKKELRKLNKEELQLTYEQTMILSLCQQEMLSKFKEMCTYFGCYKDKNYRTPLFDSYDTFLTILPEIKQQLLDNYASLELSSDELKK